MIKGTAIIGFLFFSLIGTISCNIAAGSYAYAEVYKLKVTESELVSIIQEFKKNNPDYCVPDEVQVKDGRSDKNDHWYHIYFYYKEENKIVYTWVRQFDRETTDFAFVALNNGLTLGNWKDINNDFSRKENKLEKAKFEQRILNKIKLKIK